MDRNHAVIERQIDVLTLAAAGTPDQAGADRRHAMDAGVHVGDRDPQQRWCLARIADLCHRT